jgi:hypothetical protein
VVIVNSIVELSVARIGPGVYVNALNDEVADGVRRAYAAPKFDHLTAVEDAVDPHDVFHLNHKIVPSGS